MKMTIEAILSRLDDIHNAIDIVRSYMLNDNDTNLIVELLQEYEQKIRNTKVDI